MTLSPTALEEAAKAMHGAEPWSSFWSTDDARLLATAAITAYLARAEKEGWVMVPVEPSCDQLAAGMEAWGRLDDAEEEVEAIYTEMLAAAQNGGDQ